MNILTINLAFSTFVFWVAAKTLCSAEAPGLRAQNDLVAHSIASLFATPWSDVSRTGGHLRWHANAVYLSGCLRRPINCRSGHGCYSSGRYTGAERETFSVAF